MNIKHFFTRFSALTSKEGINSVLYSFKVTTYSYSITHFRDFMSGTYYNLNLYYVTVHKKSGKFLTCDYDYHVNTFSRREAVRVLYSKCKDVISKQVWEF